jgi:glycosyltransferase involved in cell wall biosynthesis
VFTQDASEGSYEVIIVNDGTPDNSMNIVTEFAGLYPNLTIINQKNEGLSGARNKGLKTAKGKYVWFVDSDDRIEFNCVSKILRYLDQYPCDILALDFLWLFPNHLRKRDTQKFSSGSNYMKGIDYLNLNGTGQAWRNIYSRNFLKANELFFTPGIIHEDGEFNMRAKSLADKISYFPSICYYYYYNRKGSIMNSVELRHTLDYLFYTESADIFIKKRILSPAVKKGIYTAAASVVKMSIDETLFLNSTDRKRYLSFLKLKRVYWTKSCFSSSTIEHKFIGLGLLLCPKFTIRLFLYRRVLYLKNLKIQV